MPNNPAKNPAAMPNNPAKNPAAMPLNEYRELDAHGCDYGCGMLLNRSLLDDAERAASTIALPAVRVDGPAA